MAGRWPSELESREDLWKTCPRAGASCSLPERLQRDQGLSQPLRERRIFLCHRRHALKAVNHRRVIASAEGGADLDELHAEELAHEVHRDLPRDGEVLGARLGAQAFGGDPPL